MDSPTRSESEGEREIKDILAIGAAPCGHFAATRLVRSLALLVARLPSDSHFVLIFGAFSQGQAHADRGTKCTCAEGVRLPE